MSFICPLLYVYLFQGHLLCSFFQLFFFFLLAVARARQLDKEDQETDQNIDPIYNAEVPAENKLHDKRTIFKAKPIFRARHVGIHPLGFRYVLGYGHPRYHYVYKRPAVTYLKPVLHTSGWKPIIPVKPAVKPIVPVVPVKPVKPVKPVVIHTPVIQSPTAERPVVVPTPQIPAVQPVIPLKPVIPQHVVPFQPGVIQFPTTVLKPVLPNPVFPAVLPQNPVVIPQTPVVPQAVIPPVVPPAVLPAANPLLPLPAQGPLLHPFLRPLLTQFLYNLQGNLPLQPVLPAVKPLLQPGVVQPQAILPHGNHLDVFQHVKPLLPLQPPAVLPQEHVLQPFKPLFQPAVVQPEGIVHHGNHLDLVKPVLEQPFKPLPVFPQTLVPHENHLDALQPNFVQPGAVLPHANHLDVVPLNDVPHQFHLEPNGPHVHVEDGAHLHTTQHIHPEEPNVVHSETHLHQDHHLVPHVHPVHPAPQIPLYLPHHPNYKPGLPLQPIEGSSSLHTELSATFPRHPIIGQHIK